MPQPPRPGPLQQDLFPAAEPAPEPRPETPPPTVELIHSADPRVLFAAATEGFLTPRTATAAEPFPRPPALLVLRQGGLRDDLFTAATAAGVPGWFDQPACVFHELPEWIGLDRGRECADFERAALLHELLHAGGGRIMGRLRRPQEYVRAVDRLFGELVAEGVDGRAFHDAVYARDHQDAFERQRDRELADLYSSYLARLERGQRRDGRDALAAAAHLLTNDPTEFIRRLAGRRELRLVGLNDLRGGWRPLLRALATSPAVDRLLLYSARPLDLDPTLGAVVRQLPSESGLARLAERLDGAGESAAPEPRPALAVIEAPDAEREADEVARRVRALIAAGTRPNRIAVVARQARPDLDLVVESLGRFGVPATARRRIRLREIPVVRGVLTLLAAAAEGWDRHHLVEVAEQPYFSHELDIRLLNRLGYRRRLMGLTAWERALAGLEAEARSEEQLVLGQLEPGGVRRRSLPEPDRVRRAAEAFGRFAVLARPLDESRTLAEWLDWLADFLARDPWQMGRRRFALVADRWDMVRLDDQGWLRLGEVLDQWRRALELWGAPPGRLDVAGFRDRLVELLSGDLAQWTEERCGVQVLEGLAAAYRSFDHVFLLGLTAGRFPLRAPSSPLLDEADRAALARAGLPLEPHTMWDGRERELFAMLLAAGERVTLSSARIDAEGRETLPSLLVELAAEAAGITPEIIPTARVLTPGRRLAPDAATVARARHGALVEWHRRSEAPSPWNGLIEDAALLDWLAQELGEGRLWSPTQLESLGKCPWAWFSQRLLRLEEREDPSEEMDPATRGTLLHAALAHFFRLAGEHVGGAVRLKPEDLSWALPLVEPALAAALAGVAADRWLGHPTLQPVKLAEVRRMLEHYLGWEAADHVAMENPRAWKRSLSVRSGVTEHELIFNDILLERHGIRLRLRGSIDRVEEAVDPRAEGMGLLVAADYKTTKESTPGQGNKRAWDDGVVLQLPLYAHALSRLYPDHQVARVEYRALKKPDLVHRLELRRFTKQGALEAPADEAARFEAALDAAAEHVRRARAGELPTRPAPSCGCPPFCHARDICRIPGGPRDAR